MKNHQKLSLVSALCCAITFPLTTRVFAQDTAAKNVLVNGDFESATPTDGGWIGLNSAGVSIAREGDNSFVTFQNSDIAKNSTLWQFYVLPAPAIGQKWTLSGRVRVVNTTPGTENWHTVRVQTSWMDDANKVVTPWPPSPTFKEVSPDWTEFKVTLTVPAGATKLKIEPGIFHSVGEADFDDLALVRDDTN